MGLVYRSVGQVCRWVGLEYGHKLFSLEGHSLVDGMKVHVALQNHDGQDGDLDDGLPNGLFHENYAKPFLDRDALRNHGDRGDGLHDDHPYG